MSKLDALLVAAWLASGSMALEDSRRVDITMTEPVSASAAMSACHAAPALIDPELGTADVVMPFDVPMVDIAIVCSAR